MWISYKQKKNILMRSDNLFLKRKRYISIIQIEKRLFIKILLHLVQVKRPIIIIEYLIKRIIKFTLVYLIRKN